MNAENGQGLEPGVGALLRASRLRCGEELRDVSVLLRIRLPYLEAIEEGRYQELPGAAYAVGFVRTYAEHLGLDSEEVVRRFKIEAENLERKTELVFPSPIAERGTPGAAIVFIGILLVAVAYGAWYVGSSKDSVFDNIVSPLPDRLAALLPGGGNDEGDSATLPAAPAMAPTPSTTPAPIEVPEPVIVTPATPETPSPSPVVPAETMSAAESAPAVETDRPVAGQAAETVPAPAEGPAVPATVAEEPQATLEPTPLASTDVVPATDDAVSATLGAAVVTEPAQPAQPVQQMVETPVEPAIADSTEAAPQIAEAPAGPAQEVPAAPEPQVVQTSAPSEAETPADLAAAVTRALQEVAEDVQPGATTEPEPSESQTVAAQSEPEPVPSVPALQPDVPAAAGTAPGATPAEVQPEPLVEAEPTETEPTTLVEQPETPAEQPATPAAPATVSETPASSAQVAAIPAAPEASGGNAPSGRTFGVADGGARIVVRAKSDSWIQVRDGIARRLLVTRLLRAGDSYRVPDQPGLTLLTGNAGALEILVDDEAVTPIGGVGAVRRNVALDAERLLAGTAVLD